MARLVQHGQQRHAPPRGQLLRYASGQPITSRRYDHLWTRIGWHRFAEDRLVTRKDVA